MRHMVLLLNPAFGSSSPTPWHIQPSNLGTTPPHVGHLQYLYLKMYISWPIVSGVNEATFRDDSLKWITRISSCLGAWDTFLFFSSSLSFFFLFRSYMIGQLHDVWWRLSVRTKQSLACTEQKGRRGGYRHTTRSFPSLVLLCTCKWERVRTSDTKKTFWKLEKMTDDSKISTPWERILSKKGQSKTERINGINRLKLRDSAFLMLDFILW